MILIRGIMFGLAVLFISGAFANHWKAAADSERSTFLPLLWTFLGAMVGGVLLSAVIWI